MTASDHSRPRSRGRLALILAGVNAGVVGLVAGWWAVAARVIGDGGEPPGPAFAFAALVLPALFLGGGLFMTLSAVGAALAADGWLAARRLPGRPYAALNAVAAAGHIAPPVLAVLGRELWLAGVF